MHFVYVNTNALQLLIQCYNASTYTVKILLNARAFIQNSALTEEGDGRLLEATFKNSCIRSHNIGGHQSAPDKTYIPSGCLGIPCIFIFGLQEKN